MALPGVCARCTVHRVPGGHRWMPVMTSHASSQDRSRDAPCRLSVARHRSHTSQTNCRHLPSNAQPASRSAECAPCEAVITGCPLDTRAAKTLEADHSPRICASCWQAASTAHDICAGAISRSRRGGALGACAAEGTSSWRIPSLVLVLNAPFCADRLRVATGVNHELHSV